MKSVSLESHPLSSSYRSAGEGGGRLVELEGERFYCIEGVDRLDPFLMNVVSGSDHWLFAASNGGLTAGRRNADNALFPYGTQDKLIELAGATGSWASIWVEAGDGAPPQHWEPFRGEGNDARFARNLYKSLDGSEVVFEEIHQAAQLCFRYSWSTGERFGFIRQASLENLGAEGARVRLLDGIQNIVPYGLDQAFVTQFSNLADAYKKNELMEEERLGLYYLSSIPTDRAEPSEGLRATVAWSAGMDPDAVLISSRQLAAFRKGAEVTSEADTRGVRGAYFVASQCELEAGERRKWAIAADINQSAAQVEALRLRLRDGASLFAELKRDVEDNRRILRSKVLAADGAQLTSHRLRDARHRSNTLFNVMRGGVFAEGYQVRVSDFSDYLRTWNREAWRRFADALVALGQVVERGKLVAWAGEQGDPDLARIASEYLPLSFSRRHGDPSRPWNKFSIETRDGEGNAALSYQGNWRDIFQNWEALAYSYPRYLEAMVCRFLNSSTADGYNPYRISRDGFDWEVLDPEEPWSNIGYWGDHQIVYLLKLLEALDRHRPGVLAGLMQRDCFVYAHVPYRIRGFADIWANPRETIDYDAAAAAQLLAEAERMGADGKLLRAEDGKLVRANLAEKLLAPLLAKMSNFVPGGGIWMNTQRPEWNDANNALVGYGVSVVTLCYIYRYLEFLQRILGSMEGGQQLELAKPLVDLLEAQAGIMERWKSELRGGISPSLRFAILKELGESGEAYRNSVYTGEFGAERRFVPIRELGQHLELALQFARHSIDANRRGDGMYHSYNLLIPQEPDQVEIERLPEMLEGQVAALSSGRLSPCESVSLLDALRGSRLFREDVESYLLYPDKELPRFLEKNRIAEEALERIPLLRRMLQAGDRRIVERDPSGMARFNGDFRNAADVAATLEKVKAEGDENVGPEEERAVLQLFEDTFGHRQFTGRSGTFFAYEGLGSVYWHMVSKLALAIQENCCEAAGGEGFAPLAERYFETLRGLGCERSPHEYGAFPTDAYSHTPRHAGAQQPGMTGQVKEDILARWGELGLQVKDGIVRFDPRLLKASSFLQNPDTLYIEDARGVGREVEVRAGCLAFTYCQTLIQYALSDKPGVTVRWGDGRIDERTSLSLSAEESESLFGRNGEIDRIEVSVTVDRLLAD